MGLKEFILSKIEKHQEKKGETDLLGNDALSIKYTSAAIRLIQRHLLSLLFILNIVVQVLFVAYYCYLIATNLSSIPYIVLYSVLIGISLTTFTTELVLRRRKEDDQTLTKKKTATRRRSRTLIKTIKYLTKASLIAVAIYEIVTKGGSDLKIVLAGLSVFLLLFQILSDFAVYLINRYIALVSFALEEDIKKSELLYFTEKARNLRLNEKADEILNENTKNEDRQESLRLLEEEILSHRKTIEEERKEATQRWEKAQSELNKRQNEEKIQKCYQKNKEKATKLLTKKKKALSLLTKAKKETATFIAQSEEAADIPTIIDLLESFLNEEYTTIKRENLVSLLGALLSLLSPFGKNQEDILAEETRILQLCHAENQDALSSFLSWKELQPVKNDSDTITLEDLKSR